MYTGWPGCAHDARIFDNSAINHRDDFFSEDEYLFADSAFVPTTRVVPVFKKFPNQQLGRRETVFNSTVTRLRVCNEHCIGILKAKFQSLRELRSLVRNRRDVIRCTMWIMACAVLHNFTLEEPAEEEWIEPEDGRLPSSPVAPNSDASEGRRKRERLMGLLVANI